MGGLENPLMGGLLGLVVITAKALTDVPNATITSRVSLLFITLLYIVTTS